MARKTKKSEIPAADLAPVVELSVEEPKLLGLSEVELWKLRAFDAEAKAANLSANIRIIERDAFLRKIDPEGKIAAFDSEIRAYADQTRLSKHNYSEIIATIERRLDISMKDYSFDDESGTLHPIPT